MVFLIPLYTADGPTDLSHELSKIGIIYRCLIL